MNNILDGEHNIAKSFIGILGIWGIQVSLCLIGIDAQKVFSHKFFKYFRWISYHSLILFLFHRILYIKVLVPLINVLIATPLGLVLGNSYWTQTAIIIFYFLTIAWLQKIKILTSPQVKSR
jgi:hypothetical protein